MECLYVLSLPTDYVLWMHAYENKMYHAWAVFLKQHNFINTYQYPLRTSRTRQAKEIRSIKAPYICGNPAKTNPQEQSNRKNAKQKQKQNQETHAPNHPLPNITNKNNITPCYQPHPKQLPPLAKNTAHNNYYVFKQSLGFQHHSQNKQVAIFNFLKLQCQDNILISSTFS